MDQSAHGGDPRCAEAEQALVGIFRDRNGGPSLFHGLNRIREGCPVHHSDTLDQWVVTRYDDVKQVMRDPVFAVDYARQMDIRRPDWRDHPALVLAGNTVLTVDGEEHNRLRGIGVTKINNHLIQRKSPQIESTINHIVARFALKGGGDFVEEVAFAVTTDVISDLMGLPREDREWYRRAVAEQVLAFNPSVTADEMRRADAAATRVREYWQDLVRLRQQEPADDVVSDLLTAVDDTGDRLEPDEVASFSEFLFSAGFDTTVHTLSLGVLAFLENPSQMGLLRARPDLAQRATAEVLRYTTTVISQPRYATENVGIAGHEIPGDSLILCSLAAANRDPSAFPNPDTFQIDRTAAPHVTFGWGRHRCLGAPLAAAEIQMVLEALVTTTESLELGPGAPEYEHRLSPRAMRRLPVTVVPRSDLTERVDDGGSPN